MANAKFSPSTAFDECQGWWRDLSAVFNSSSDVVHVSDVFAYASSAKLTDDQALDAIDWAKVDGMLEPFPGGSYVRLTSKGAAFCGLTPRLSLIVNRHQ
jgi:hypothetical protein